MRDRYPAKQTLNSMLKLDASARLRHNTLQHYSQDMVPMKLLIDFLPIVIFFIVYKFAPETVELISPILTPSLEADLAALSPIILATAVLIPATVLQMLYTRWTTGSIEKMQLVTLLLVVVLGGMTVLLQNKAFIQWKPTIVNWLFAAAFWGSQVFTQKSLIERMMGGNLSLPSDVWIKLNYAWVAFFIGSGILNLVVAYQFSEEAWVNFKLFGLLGLTLVFIVVQTLFLQRYIKQEES